MESVSCAAWKGSDHHFFITGWLIELTQTDRALSVVTENLRVKLFAYQTFLKQFGSSLMSHLLLEGRICLPDEDWDENEAYDSNEEHIDGWEAADNHGNLVIDHTQCLDLFA